MKKSFLVVLGRPMRANSEQPRLDWSESFTAWDIFWTRPDRSTRIPKLRRSGPQQTMAIPPQTAGGARVSDDLEDLISRCALGDRAAFAALYDATSAKLYAVCARVLGQDHAAEDAMQDAYVKIWAHAGRYRVTGHAPMTWLITIARNTAIDRLRARRLHHDIEEHHGGIAAPGPSPESVALARSEAGRIQRCLEELEQDRRAAITGAYLDGLSYAELATRAGIPLNTMRTWLRRGLAALRECMSR
jgi:RNA polymerase sigma-70 factor (ECF subfamily)